MKKVLLIVLGAFFVPLLFSFALLAQATAQMGRTVRDQTGAVLPGVEVTVTQSDAGTTRSGITNEIGTYVLPNLPIGPYRLEATCSLLSSTFSK